MMVRPSACTDDLIIAEVWIDVAPTVVWGALTDPRQLQRWWGSPETYRSEQWTIDLRVGGKWKSCGTSNDGSTFEVEGEFVEVVPTGRLVMTWMPSWDPGVTTKVAYTLSAERNGTRLRLEHSGFAGRAASRDNHALGWQAVLGWLGEFAERDVGEGQGQE